MSKKRVQEGGYSGWAGRGRTGVLGEGHPRTNIGYNADPVPISAELSINDPELTLSFTQRGNYGRIGQKTSIAC